MWSFNYSNQKMHFVYSSSGFGNGNGISQENPIALNRAFCCFSEL